MDAPILRTSRLLVRPPDRSDAPAVAAYVTENRSFHAPWDPAREESYFTREAWERQLAADAEAREEGREIRFALFESASGSLVGMARLSNVARGVARFASLGYALAERAQGRGLMGEALTAIIDHAFGPMDLHRIHANYMPRNERSGKLLRSLGFQVEGYARDYLFLNGRWEDHILTGLINPDSSPSRARS